MIYTKTGDKGSTLLADGTHVSKTDPRLEAYGTIDELNSHIGLLIAMLQPPTTPSTSSGQANHQSSILSSIQSDLFVIGSILAGAPQSASFSTALTPEDIEHEIDQITAQLPQVHSFILPAGTPAACQTHICRTVCRRAERLIWRLDFSFSDSYLPQYLNRLSDYFFVLARHINIQASIPEQFWQPSPKM